MSDQSSNSGKWVVWRQDDNGNKFVLAVAASKAEAMEIQHKYEAAGHKQAYWIEPLEHNDRLPRHTD